eukprot:gene5727-6427_t
MAAARVLIYGGNGALGKACVTFFKSKSWSIISVDLTPNEEADTNVIVTELNDWVKQFEQVQARVNEVMSGSKLDAVLCVAGGWAGGNAKSKNFIKNADLMWKQSVWTSSIAANIAAHHLKENGLLTLPGAFPALGGTSGMMGYGLAKAAVHQLTYSLANENSGLPSNTVVLALLPMTLDTPMNRKGMPNADFSAWTSLEYVASLFYDWTQGVDVPKSGSLVGLVTKDGQTSLECTQCLKIKRGCGAINLHRTGANAEARVVRDLEISWQVIAEERRQKRKTLNFSKEVSHRLTVLYFNEVVFFAPGVHGKSNQNFDRMACVTVNNSVCVFLVFTLCFFIVVCDDCPTACRCFTLDTGGQKVQCSLLGIKTPRLDKLPKATVELNLAYNQIKVIRKDSFPVSRKLKRLDLKGNQIQHIEPGAFKKFPRLTKLYLQVNKLTKIDKNTFRGLRNLKHLNISQNSLLYIHQQAFHGLKNLKRISLKKNKLTTLPKSTFSNSSKIELDDNDLICDCDMSWLVAITKEKRRGVSDNSKCKYPTLLAGKKIRYLATKNWNCRNAAFELPKFQTSPTENQIVFQNDSLELTCTSIWQPRGRITWQIHPASVRDITIRDYSDVNSRENKTVLSIKKIDVHHSGVYTCKAHVNEVNQVVKSVEVTVIGWQTEFCPKQAKATSKGTFVWQSTAPGGHVQYACPFGTDLRASRNCSARGVWQTADLSKCHEKNILTRKISILKKRNINSTSIQSTINTFLNITRTHKDTFSNIQQLQLLAEVFSSVCSAKFPIASDSSKLIKSSVSAMLTSMLLINVSLYQEDPLKDNSTSKLIKSFEELLADYLNREIKQSPKNVPVIVPVTSSVAGYSRSYRPKYPHGLVCTVLFKDHQDKSNSGFGECGISINGTKTLEGFNAQVIIPKMFFALSSSSIFDDPRQLTKVSFIAYKTAELFRDHKFTKIQSTTPETMISSAVVGIHVEVPGIGSTSLVTNDNVVFKFRKRRVGSKPRLIYWATKITKTGTRNWWKLSKHCRLLSETSSYVRFACSELPGKMTYFSVIMDIARKEKPVASFRLEIVTHFGAALCSVFLLMTLATYAFFRELRYNRNDAATLMNLCLALTVAVIIFVVGITRTENKLLCKSFAVLLHYFLLCGLLWLGCGGACLTSFIKKGPDNEEYSPVLKYYLISWGLPMIVCGITLAGNSNNYSTSN